MFKVLIFILMVVVGCASSGNRPADSKAEKVQFIGLKADPNAVRLAQFFKKEAQVSFQDDQLSVYGLLQLPQIEMPLSKEREEKFNMKRVEDNDVHVFNGHVCVQVGLESKLQKDHLHENWRAGLQVDGKVVKTEWFVRPRVVFDLVKGESNGIPGALDATVCSLSKHLQVTTVAFTLLSNDKKVLTKMSWSAPWPPLHNP